MRQTGESTPWRLKVQPKLGDRRASRHEQVNARAEGIVTACAYCDIQLSQVQLGGRLEKSRIPVMTLPQFLGPALGILDEDLGMHMNRISPSRILESLTGVRY